MAKTFVELEKDEEPTSKDVSRTLEICAKGGHSISGQVVTGIIHRVQPTRREKIKLLRLARLGARRQKTLGHPMDVEEYRKVIDFLM